MKMSKSWHGGKGSNPRPIKYREQFEDNWDRIFGTKENRYEESRQGKTKASTSKENQEKSKSKEQDL
jgi:hypothetical protein